MLCSKISRAKLLSRCMIASSSVLLLAAVIIFQPERVLMEALEAELQAEQLSGTIVHLDEVLTMSVRMYAATGDPVWAERYRRFEPQLDDAIKRLIALAPSPNIGQTGIERTDAANLALVEMETRALELTRQGNREEAEAILQSAAYPRNKSIYSEGISTTTANIRASLNNRIRQLRRDRSNGSVLLGLALITMMIAVGAALKDDKQTDTNSRKLAQIVEQSPAIIMITDTEGRLEYVNSMFTQVTGYPAEEVIGQTPRILKSGEMPPEAYAHLWNTITVGRQWRGEFLDKTRNGASFWAAATISPIADSDGMITGFVGMQEDITEKKRAEEENRKLQADLYKSRKMEAIGFMAGGIAHDFNNILGAILGSAELALLNAPDQGKLTRQLNRIVEGGCRAKELVKQILLFSRGADSAREPVAVAEIVTQAVDLIRVSLPAMVEIRQDIDANTGHISGDRTQLHQIVVNLCINAGHAMKASGGILGIRVSRVEIDAALARTNATLEEGPYVKLVVSDTGCGMDEATQQRIFDPFFTTKGVDAGTGMGLAVVHGIVTDHNGAIIVDSAPGRGTTFEIYIPVCPAEVTSATDGHEHHISGTESVLVVDDEPILAEAAAGLLTPLGYRVTTTTDGFEALETFARHPQGFDIIVTDQAMPRMSGVELAKQIRDLNASIPILVASGYSDRVTPDNAGEHGFHGYVGKPYTARELGLAIRTALDDAQA